MSRKIFLVLPLVLALVSVSSGTAGARGHGGPLSPEQFTAMQEIHAEFYKRVQPLQQDLYDRQAELEALLFKGAAYDNPEVQKLMREIDDLDTKLYTAQKELRSRMIAKGIPPRGSGMGWRYGGWHGGPGRCGGPGYFGSGAGCFF
jgi:zinc resistance-associated protein